MTIPDQYVWLFWSSAFLLPWLALYLAYPQHRRAMRWASVLTAPFGLTEPIFVPEYWSPPSLFDLAMRTGFDIESVIFSFGIGGIGVVLYNIVTRRRAEPMPEHERHAGRHRFHDIALFVPAVLFGPLWLLPWNPIYPSILAMLAGAVATMLCRPDLKRNILVGGGVFVGFYSIVLVGLDLTAPGYVERVWNLAALSGVQIGHYPLEELLFAFAFGGYWASVYEHSTWHRSVPVS